VPEIFDAEFSGAFGSGFCQVIFDSNTLGERIGRGAERVNRAVDTVMEQFAPQIEAAAKINAPWTDQTGNARNGLAARAGVEGRSHFIALYGQVPYQIWLEVRWSGRYAIIMPTLDEFTPRVIEALNGILGKDIFS
jgi:hypothetical protein